MITARTAFGILCLSLAATATAQEKVNRSKPMVVVISLDAFGAESLRDPNVPAPTLRMLMKQGAYARSMQPVNPTVTWPNHTAMVTGDTPAQHHVLANGLIQNQRTEGSKAAKIWADAPKSELVAVPTVYDAAHDAGMTSAEVDWVAIYHASSINWRFHEDPDVDGPVEQEMIKAGVASHGNLQHFHHGQSQAWRDQLYTEAAARIIKQHHPNLMLLHLLALDSVEHHYGFGTEAGFDTIAFLDGCVKKIVEAVQEAGDADRTTFLIVSDHGQQSLHHHIATSAYLREAGITSDEAIAIPEGGLALIYEKHASPALTEKLKAAYEGKPGVRSVVTPDHYAAEGLPTPAVSSQAPDLIAYAMDDYAFAGGETSPAISDVPQAGAHGYPNTNPLMQEIFIAAGKGIKPSGEIASFPNLNIAPTIAVLLGVKLDNVQGKPLSSILR